MKYFWIPLVALALNPALGQTPIIPHLTSADGGFQNTLVLINKTQNTVEYALTGYVEGVPLTKQGSIAPGAVLRQDARTFFGRDGVSHLKVTRGDDLVVMVEYQTEGEGSPTFMKASDQTSASWRFLTGDGSATWDGFAVVNTGDEPAAVTVRQLTRSGEEVKSVEVITGLQPNFKGLYLLSDHFETPANTDMEITSNQPLALAALRFSRPDVRYFWVNEAIPGDL